MKWLVLVWPFLAATSANRNYIVERIAVWHALIASYVAWGVITGLWYPPLRPMLDAPSWLPWVGWAMWVAVFVTSHFVANHAQFSFVLAFFGTWMIGYGGHPPWLPVLIFIFVLVNVHIHRSPARPSVDLMRLADSMLRQPKEEDRK